MPRNRRLNMLKWCNPNLRSFLPIAKELEQYPDIRTIDIAARSLTMTKICRDIEGHLYGEFGISFSKMASRVRKDAKIIDMRVTIWLGKDRIDGRFTATGTWSDASYLDYTIQNWLYTYFVNTINSIDNHGRFGDLRFPDIISNWYPGSEWDYLPLIRSYVGSVTEMIETTTQLKQVARKNTVPRILEAVNTI